MNSTNMRRVHFLIDLTIHDAKRQELEDVVNSMLEGTGKEPGALGYEWFLSADGKRCRLLETYADANAVQAHLSGPVVQKLVPKLLEVSSITRFEVYGVPDAAAVAALEGLGAEMFRYWKELGRAAA